MQVQSFNELWKYLLFSRPRTSTLQVYLVNPLGMLANIYSNSCTLWNFSNWYLTRVLELLHVRKIGWDSFCLDVVQKSLCTLLWLPCASCHRSHRIFLIFCFCQQSINDGRAWRMPPRWLYKTQLRWCPNHSKPWRIWAFLFSKMCQPNDNASC